jgi:hypothetical protein
VLGIHNDQIDIPRRDLGRHETAVQQDLPSVTEAAQFGNVLGEFPEQSDAPFGLLKPAKYGLDLRKSRIVKPGRQETGSS